MKSFACVRIPTWKGPTSRLNCLTPLTSADDALPVRNNVQAVQLLECVIDLAGYLGPLWNASATTGNTDEIAVCPRTFLDQAQE